MKTWIDPDLLQKNLEKVRIQRVVADKGIDIMGEVLSWVSEDLDIARKLQFVFVGSGKRKDMLEATQEKLEGDYPTIIIQPPSVRIAEPRN